MIIPYSCHEAPLALVIFDIDGVVRDVAQSYRRAIADTVEYYTQGEYRPSMADLDALKTEGIWNNDWKASEELIFRHYESHGKSRDEVGDHYDEIVDFFQGKYRGDNYSGYIKDEPLLMTQEYLQSLSDGQIGWGFFSGATQGSANFVLQQRLEIQAPVLIAMEDAPSKPDPQGLFQAIDMLLNALSEQKQVGIPVLYVGDTVADMKTAQNAAQKDNSRPFYSIGIIPPHAWESNEYAPNLKQHGAVEVYKTVTDLTPLAIKKILDKSNRQGTFQQEAD
ncbi:MAG: TIGR01548 family HAD-type hydrolase [Acaryochloridaceae cyanobacterium RL_2_7]|nr:TIGR01548 family HAD-type hydrolase [Acaryochloridaceae cyanobacterium RL_2_7]